MSDDETDAEYLARMEDDREEAHHAYVELQKELDRLRADLKVERQNGRVLQRYFDQAIEIALEVTSGSEANIVWGWGVWHAEDEQWIGFGVTGAIAGELIPEGPDYGHLSLRSAKMYIVANEGDGHE